ncbi:MAG: hypothetical protein ACPGR8_13525, partial [Limisphaerales bacterium]
MKLVINSTEWDRMETCSKTEYKSCILVDDGQYDKPPKCDYQPAMCAYNDGPLQACEVRRKGVASWRDMGNKPSFKIKFEEDVQFANYSCATTSACASLPTGRLAGSEFNVWKADKVTLNNRVQGYNEVDAYRAFRDVGLVAPLAANIEVSVYRGLGDRVYTGTYAMVETISDGGFMKKYFSKDKQYILWENPADEANEWKRARGDAFEDAYDSVCDTCRNETNPELCGLYRN